MIKPSLIALLTCTSLTYAIAYPLIKTQLLAQDSPSSAIAQASTDKITVKNIEGFQGIISSLVVDAQDNLLLISTGEGSIIAMNLADLQPIYTQTFAEEPRSLLVMPNQKSFMAALDKNIQMFKLEDGMGQKKWQAHVGKITKIAISDPKQLLASISANDGTIKLWELESSNPITTFGDHKGPVTAIGFSPDGKLLVTGASGNDRTLKFWDMDTLELIKTTPQQPGYIYDLAITPNGKKLVAAIRNMIKVWDLASGKELLTSKVTALDLNAIAISPDSQVVATANKEGTISLIDINKGKLIATLRGHKGWVTSLTFSSDGQYLYSGAEDKIVKIWDLQAN